jgi:Flp pilus assembly protein TadD
MSASLSSRAEVIGIVWRFVKSDSELFHHRKRSNALRNSGHESGDFVFIRKQPLNGRTQAATSAKVSTQDNSESAMSRGASAQGGAAANPIPENLTAKEYGDIAEQAIEAHQWKRAEMAYRIALLKAPNHAAYHSQLCFYVLSKEQRLMEAEAECREAVRLKPETAVFHGNLAYVLGREKRLAEAEAAPSRAFAARKSVLSRFSRLRI